MNLPRHVLARTILLVTLASHGLVASGVPLPMAPPQRATLAGDSHSASAGDHERYPCESSQCGCTSAEDCWDHCCCFTLQQRLAWAERHDVEPPDWVEHVARHTDAIEQPRPVLTTTSSACKCCPTASTVCSTESPQNTLSPQDDSARNPEHQAKSGDASSKTVGLWQALRCRGLSYDLAVAVPALPDLSRISLLLCNRHSALQPAKSLYEAPQETPPAPPPEYLG